MQPLTNDADDLGSLERDNLLQCNQYCEREFCVAGCLKIEKAVSERH